MPVSFRKLRSKAGQNQSDTTRDHIIGARRIQTQRFGTGKLITNATMTHKQTEKYCPLSETCEQLLQQAMVEFALSARAHDKICKVARTIADLEEYEEIQAEHLAEAISYRKLDRAL